MWWISLRWKSWEEQRPKSCQRCLVHLMWWCLIRMGRVFVCPWFVTLGWGLCKWVFASDSARTEWWRSRPVQTGAGNAPLPWKKLFHMVLLRMPPVVLCRQVLVLYQPQQEVRTPPANLAQAFAVVRKNALSCYLLCRAGLFSPFPSSPFALQPVHHCPCLSFFFYWQRMLPIYSCLEENFENSILPFNLISAGS